MGTLRQRVKADTLVEVVVASVIFLIVFMIGFETLTRLTIREDEGLVLVEADRCIGECFREFSNGRYPLGQYERKYEWGSIEAVIAPYRDYRSLQMLTLKALLRENRRRIEYHYVIELKE